MYLRYPIRTGVPLGGPPPPPSLLICGGCCVDCIRLHMPPSFYLLSSLSVALLKQICSLLLLAYCFSGTSVASRSMIAQVSIFVVFPKENLMFLKKLGGPICQNGNISYGKPMIWDLKRYTLGGPICQNASISSKNS